MSVHRYIILCIIIIGHFQNSTLQSQSKFIIEFSSGFPVNLPLPLTIRQRGESEIHINARYATRPMEVPIYWDWRLSILDNNESAWELESIHHKLFLENKPEQIGTFSISHGLNFVTINRSWLQRIWGDNKINCRLGIGIIIAHPESEIRGLKFNENGGLFDLGYFLTGPSAVLGVSKRMELFNNLFANLEMKLSLAIADVPKVNGSASVYNTAFHLVFGLGYAFIIK